MTKKKGVKPLPGFLILLFAVLIFAGLGCGKKAPPVPPADNAAPVESLSKGALAPHEGAIGGGGHGELS